jgi:hypothetical protein
MLQLATTTDMATIERRRALRVRKTPTIDVMRRENPNGTPLRLCDLVLLTGFTKMKLIRDIRRGFLAADQDPASRIYLIQFREAQRYLRTLGII